MLIDTLGRVTNLHVSDYRFKAHDFLIALDPNGGGTDGIMALEAHQRRRRRHCHPGAGGRQPHDAMDRMGLPGRRGREERRDPGVGVGGPVSGEGWCIEASPEGTPDP